MVDFISSMILKILIVSEMEVVIKESSLYFRFKVFLEKRIILGNGHRLTPKGNEFQI
jgi:hypothetical protein